MTSTLLALPRRPGAHGVEVLLVVGVAQAAADLEVGCHGEVHVAEGGPGLGGLVLHGIAVLRVADGEAVEVEAVHLQLLVEVIQAGDPLQRVAGVGLQAEFLRRLAQGGDAVSRLRVKRDDRRVGCRRAGGVVLGAVRDAAETAAEAAVHVAAAVELGAVVGGDGVQRHAVEVPAQARADFAGRQCLRVVAVGRVAGVVVAVDQVVRAALHDVGAEGGCRALEVAGLDLEQAGEIAVLVGRLHAQRLVVVALEVGRGVGQRVVHAVILALHHAGDTHLPVVAQRHVDGRFDVDRIPAAEADVGIAFRALARLGGVELHDARRRVAAEEGALRAAQQLHLLHVEHREALERDAFLHDIVVDQADRLGRVHVEVGVAQAAHIKAREGAAVVRLDVQAGHLARQRADVLAAGVVGVQILRLDRRDRQRHVPQVLGAAAAGHDDRFELADVLLGLGCRRGLGHGCLHREGRAQREREQGR